LLNVLCLSGFDRLADVEIFRVSLRRCVEADLFRPGSTFRGMVCPANRSSDTNTFFKVKMNIVILSARRSPFFTPQTVLRVMLQRLKVLVVRGIEYVGNARYLTWNGRYNHAKRQLTIERKLPGSLPYVIVCDVYPNDDNPLFCTTHAETSMDVVERGIYIRAWGWKVGLSSTHETFNVCIKTVIFSVDILRISAPNILVPSSSGFRLNWF